MKTLAAILAFALLAVPASAVYQERTGTAVVKTYDAAKRSGSVVLDGTGDGLNFFLGSGDKVEPKEGLRVSVELVPGGFGGYDNAKIDGTATEVKPFHIVKPSSAPPAPKTTGTLPPNAFQKPTSGVISTVTADGRKGVLGFEGRSGTMPFFLDQAAKFQVKPGMHVKIDVMDGFGGASARVFEIIPTPAPGPAVQKLTPEQMVTGQGAGVVKMWDEAKNKGILRPDKASTTLNFIVHDKSLKLQKGDHVSYVFLAGYGTDTAIVRSVDPKR